MARPKGGLLRVEGKLGDHTVTRKGRYGSYIRKIVKPGTKKHEPALQQQHSRTGFLNALAADINTLVKENSEGLKSSRFYELVQSRFRKEPMNNRLLLLQTLKGMEVNPVYPFEKHGLQNIACACDKVEIHVTIAVDKHPALIKNETNCYYYEVLAATWNRKECTANGERQHSEWISMSLEKPVFDFFFARPKAAIHWMVCVRIRLGKDGVAAESFKADGMQIIDCGSFDKTEQEWLMTRNEKVEKPVQQEMRKPVSVVRVKARGG